MAQIRTLNFKEDILFSFATWHVLMIILFAIFSDYAFEETIEARYALEHSNGSLPLAELLEGIHVDQGENSQDAIRGRQVYEYYKDIAVMIFIGFGFLMTFLKKYGFGAVGFTFLISSIAAEWTILNDAFWVCIHEGCGTSLPFIKLDVLSLVFGMFGAGAVMISFGAVLGKVSANQMFLLALLEVVFYSVNVYVGYLVLEVIDVGGSAFIHLFGAYFGLGATYFLTPEKSKRNFRDNESAYHSDLFSFIGTVFLWIYWPSFNAVLVDQQYQNRALVNTVLSLMSACIMAFFASRTLRHAYFDAVDIQNATLAGGVAVGASCNFAIQPFGAMCAGGFAGFMSVVGYRYVQAKVEAWGFHDTCGVHNLHGIPGVIGSLVGVIATAILANTKESELAQMPHGTSQWAFQLAGSVISFAIAVVGGLFSGFVTSKLMPPSEINYTDELFWSVPTAPIAFTREDIRDDIVRVHAARTASSSVEDVEAGEMYAAAAAKADTVTAKPTGTTRKGKATSETENADKDKGKGKDKASKAKAKAKEAKSASVTASGSYYSYTS